jgi:ribosomal protein S6--L-glutamate ligase
MILSYHPILTGDINHLCAGRDPDEEDLALMRKAKVIILPQGCSEALWRAARQSCNRIFPDYSHRFAYPGKLGDIRLFRHYRLPHPRSWLFSSVGSCPAEFWKNTEYPLVVKHNYGGEGSHVFLLADEHGAVPLLEMFRGMEGSGFYGFMAQQYVPTDSRDLRVVILGKKILSYWRVQTQACSFYHNLSKGAVIDHTSDPHLQAAGREWAWQLSRRTGINLAGLDFLFPLADGKISPSPLFLEINYYFGRSGLGGLERYYTQLREALKDWLLETLLG